MKNGTPSPASAARFGSFFAIALLFILPAPSCRGPEPSAIHGVLKQRAHGDFRGNGSLRLNGEWEFFWNKFTLKNIPGRGHIVSVPDSWTNYSLSGSNPATFGYATYRLQLILDSPRENMAISGIVSSAHRVYVNGRLVRSVGNATPTPAGFRAHFHSPVSKPFRLEKDNVIIVQVANFVYHQGGIIQSLELGPHGVLTAQRRNRQWFTILLVGSILFMAVYHVFLLALNPGERSALYFIAMCIAVSTRMLLVNERVMHDFIPDLPFELYTRLIFVATYGIFLACVLFFVEMFPGRLHRRALQFLIIGTVLLMLSALFLPLHISPHALPIFGLLICGSTLTAAIILSREKTRGALILMLGLACIFAAGLNDVLHSMQIINTGFYMHYGFAVLVLAQSFLVSSRILHQLKTSNERLLSLDRLKDEFLANTSHELRTPLQGIIGMADALRDDVSRISSPAADRRVELIVASGRRLSRLVGDILDFSRLRSSEIRLHLSAMHLRPLVDLQLEFIAYNQGPDQDLKYFNDVPEDLPAVRADESRLSQIMQNLLGNAVKFTRAGEIRVGAKRAEGDMIEISIGDTGPGIPPGERERIFQPFVQAGDAGGGTGLGLSIARSLVELQGGRLRLGETNGPGTILLLPCLSRKRAIP